MRATERQEKLQQRAAPAAPTHAAPSGSNVVALQRSVGNRQVARLFGFGKKKKPEPKPEFKPMDKTAIDHRILAERAMHAITDAIDVGMEIAVERVNGGDPSRLGNRMVDLIAKAKTDLATAVTAMQKSSTGKTRADMALKSASRSLRDLQLDTSVFTADGRTFRSMFAGHGGSLEELALVRTKLHQALTGTATPGKAEMTGHYGGIKPRSATYDEEMTDTSATIANFVSQLEGLVGSGKRYNTVKEGMIGEWGWSEAQVDKYLGEKANIARVAALTDEEREGAEVLAEGGELKRRGKRGSEPFDTAGWFSKFKGKGFGIYVMDASGKIYSGQHTVGLFHHSTFLRGGSVVGAGEWMVLDGKLKHLTNKSGHYLPGREQLHNVLSELARRNVPLSGVGVTELMPDRSNKEHAKDAAGLLAEFGGMLAGPPEPVQDEPSSYNAYGVSEHPDNVPQALAGGNVYGNRPDPLRQDKVYLRDYNNDDYNNQGPPPPLPSSLPPEKLYIADYNNDYNNAKNDQPPPLPSTPPPSDKLYIADYNNDYNSAYRRGRRGSVRIGSGRY